MDKETIEFIHEINNKIGMISGNVELLALLDVQPEVKNKIEKINKLCSDLIIFLKKRGKNG